MTPEQHRKLPRYARKHIGDLEREIQKHKNVIAVLKNKVPDWMDGGAVKIRAYPQGYGTDHCIPMGKWASIEMDTEHGSFRFGMRRGALEVYAEYSSLLHSGRLVVIPIACNVVELRNEKQE